MISTYNINTIFKQSRQEIYTTGAYTVLNLHFLGKYFEASWYECNLQNKSNNKNDLLLGLLLGHYRQEKPICRSNLELQEPWAP